MPHISTPLQQALAASRSCQIHFAQHRFYANVWNAQQYQNRKPAGKEMKTALCLSDGEQHFPLKDQNHVKNVFEFAFVHGEKHWCSVKMIFFLQFSWLKWECKGICCGNWPGTRHLCGCCSPAMACGSEEYSCTSITPQSRDAFSFFSLEADGATLKRPCSPTHSKHVNYHIWHEAAPK